MGHLQRFGAGRGIDTADNKIFQKDGYLEDALNVAPTRNDGLDGNIVGRPGNIPILAGAGVNGLLQVTDTKLYDKSKYGLYSIGEKLYKLVSGSPDTWVTVGDADFALGTEQDGVIDWAEYNGSLYLAKYSVPVSKFSGNSLNQAGIDVKGSAPNFENGRLFEASKATAVSDVVASAALNVGTQVITSAAHGFFTNTRVKVTSSGAVPTGLDVLTVYYIYVIDANSYSLMLTPTTSSDNLDITKAVFSDQGSGNITFTSQTTGTVNGYADFAAVLTRIDETGEEIVSSPYLLNPILVPTTTTATNFNNVSIYGDSSQYKRVYLRTRDDESPSEPTTTSIKYPYETTNAQVGDWLYVRGRILTGDVTITPRKVTSIDTTGKYVYFEREENAFYSTSNGALSNWIMDVYYDYAAVATNLTGVFKYYDTFIVYPDDTTTYLEVPVYVEGASTGIELNVDTNVASVIPKAKYIEFFQDTMVLANVELYDEAYPQSIVFSDVDAIDYHVEKFDASYNEIKIGEDDEGVITEIKKNGEGLVIFKEKAIYTLLGEIQSRNFTIRKVEGQSVGCIAAASIIDIRGSLVFLSDLGVFNYRIGMYSAERMDTKYPVAAITPSVYSLSIYNRIKDQYMLYLPSEAVGFIPDSTPSRLRVFDFPTLSWWQWDGIDAIGGLAYIEDDASGLKTPFFTTVTGDCKRYDNDYASEYDLAMDGVTETAISKYIKSAWENLNKQEFHKKFISAKIFALYADAAGMNITVSAKSDWESDDITSEEIRLNSTYMTKEITFDSGKRQAKSIQVIISHNAKERFILSGWSLEFDDNYFEAKKFDKELT